MNWRDLLNWSSSPLLIGVFATVYSLIAWLVVGAPFLSILLASTITFGLIASNLQTIKTRKYAYIFLGIVIVKLIFLVLNAKYKIPFMAGVDWVNYDTYAREAIAGNDTIVAIFNASLDFFVFLMAIIYKTFGANAEQIYFYIFPLSLLLVSYVRKVVLLLTKKEKTADRAGLLMLAWPIDMIFSVALLREIPIQLAVIASFFHFAMYHYYKKSRSLILAFVFVVLATLMHSGMIGIFLIYLYALLQDKMNKEYKFVRIGALIVALLVIPVLMFTPLWESMSKRFSSSSTEAGVVTALENQSKYLGDAATNYISTAPQDFGGVIASIPYRFAMFALAPLPWQVHDVATVVSFVMDGALQIFIVYAVIRIYRNRAVLTIKARNMAVLIIMCVMSTYLIFSLGTSNYGTAIRHRAKVAPLVVVLISAYGLKKRRQL